MDNIVKLLTAIDLGGKFTGVLSVVYFGQEMFKQEDFKASIFCLKDNAMTYYAQERTATRHHSRAIDRFRNARNLIYLLLAELNGKDLSKDERIAISSLMHRRGYTRLESEISSEVLDDCFADFFAKEGVLNDYFSAENSLRMQFDAIAADIYEVKKFYEKIIKIDPKKLKRAEDKKALSTMKSICEDTLFQEFLGHKHRKEYFRNIYEDLKKDSRLQGLRDRIGIDRLYKCLGNVSNLQQRALRWYFDDVKMKNGGYYDADRLKNVLIRAYKFFHYDNADEEKSSSEFKLDTKSASKLILEFKNSKNILDTLCEIDPVRTIPPYEDQNNRRPPVDHTLLLNPLALDKQYKNWTKWAQAFINDIKFIDGDLDEIVNLIDRKSRLDKDTKDAYTKEKIKYAYVLQRVFDLSKNDYDDRTWIRFWARNSLGLRASKVEKYLNDLLGYENLESFKELAKKYYEELDLSKTGMWIGAKDPIFEQSNIHPPLKNKLKDELVANVLCIHDEFNFDDFKKEIWSAKVTGNSTVKSICAKIDKSIKAYRNAFNELYTVACARNNQDEKTESDKNNKKSPNNSDLNLTKEEKDLVKISKDVEKVADFVAKKLNINDQSIRFKNPYSLAQLYNLIETNIGGFSSTCEAVNKENNWRMHSESGSGAVCTRLAAECVRPFDGVVRKIIERQAYEIATIKADEIRALSIRNDLSSKIELIFLIEENSFDFTASLDKIKKSRNSSSKKDFSDKEYVYFESKNDRIFKDSFGMCPYTGKPLTSKEYCELDHIIPRSKTKALKGTIFNSELNLIYVSLKNNQNKNNFEQTLESLSSKFLKKVFNTSDIEKIEQNIDETVRNVKAKNPNFLVDLMTDEERIRCRLALFMPNSSSDAYQTIFNALAKSYTSRVNGTQAYLVKCIISNVQKMLSNYLKEHNCTLEFYSRKIDSKKVHEVRYNLSKYNEIYKKKKNQPITSHAIDALCVLAAGCNDKAIADKISSDSCIYDLSDPKVLSEYIPSIYEIKSIKRKNFDEKETPESRKLFKDTIYAEHFLPILTKGETIRVGFDWYKNSCEISSKKWNIIEDLLLPYFVEEYKKSSDLKSYHINKSKVFNFFDCANKIELDDKMKAQLCLLTKMYFTTERKGFSDAIEKEKDTPVRKSTKKTEENVEVKTEENVEVKTEENVENKAEDGDKKKSTKSPFAKFIYIDRNSFKIKLVNKDPKDKKEKNELSDHKIELGVNKDVIFPSVNELLMLRKEFEAFKEKSLKEDSSKKDKLIENEFIRDFLSRHKKGSSVKHRKCPRSYSIPVISSPSGGIRIKRKTADGGYVYQLVALNLPDTIKEKGFLVENDKINFDQPVSVNAYKAKNLCFSPFRIRRQLSEIL